MLQCMQPRKLYARHPYADPGASSGAIPSTDPGAGSGAIPGAIPSTDPGAIPGADPGAIPDLRPGICHAHPGSVRPFSPWC